METLSFTIMFLCAIHLSYAKNILYPGESLFPNQSLVSNSSEFKFGFFTAGGPSNFSEHGALYYYIGVWLADTVSQVQPPALDDTSGVAWVGNRENPVVRSLPSELSLSNNGDLILTQSQKLIWSSNATQAEQISDTVLLLLDTGNLVLCDRTNSNKVMWQSFYHPANTWFPGAGIGFTNIDGENKELSLVSWKDWKDPSPGIYTLEMDQSQTRGFFIRQIPENILYFGTFPAWLGVQLDLHNGLISFNYTKRSPTDVIPYFHLYSTGVLQLIHNYQMIWSTPGFNCANPNTCGPYALCYDKGTSFACECPYGFSNISSIDTIPGSNSSAGSAGCARNISWNCGAHYSHHSKRFSFYLLQNLVKLPANSQYLGVQSKEECESACLNNCSCTAYASGTGCNLWHGELINIVVRDDGLSGESLYIRIVVSNSKTNWYRFIIGGVVFVLFIFICLILIWKFRGYLLFFKRDNNNDPLSIYSYTHIKHATGQFSMKIGEGGFGSVFKGRLSNHTEIAVKKLKTAGLEEKQFRIEVQTIGMIRHANLVRLLGFCAEGYRRILVYEYMSKGSLNSHLFTESANILSWQERFKIAIGIARGLTYLHEECRDCIIHCDIKPENVLLDEHFSPKISDFGMAKLLGRDFSRALTTIKGTVGYLAPEWYSGEAITQRADVYSFGMMLFEIISGKRNSSEFNNKRYPYFPLYATVKMNEGEVLCLLDEKLGGNVDVAELIRACKVAGWCIQEPEACRPSMKKVVLMLKGTISVGIPPVPKSLLNLVDADDY